MTARTATIFASCAVIISVVAGLMIGPTAIAPADILPALLGHGDPVVAAIVETVRLPRVIAAMLAGIALGASGTALQALLRNPLAEPGVMGVSAAAATCATGVVYFGIASAAPWIVPAASMIGAMAAVALIAMAAIRFRGVGTMLLIGVALSAFSGAIMALFVNMAPNPFSLSDLMNWTAGSVANRDWQDIMLSAPFIAGGVLLLLSQRASMSAFALGEESAHAVGVDLRRARFAIIVGAGAATGGSVALAGMIGFVGLVAPHIIRPALGGDSGRSLLPSALIGAALLIVGDIGIRLFPWGNELHLGTLAALIGTPLFVVIILRAGQVRHG